MRYVGQLSCIQIMINDLEYWLYVRNAALELMVDIVIIIMQYTQMRLIQLTKSLFSFNLTYICLSAFKSLDAKITTPFRHCHIPLSIF